MTTKSPTAIAAPVTMEIEQVFKDKSQLEFLMPGIMSIVLMFISFMLASITMGIRALDSVLIYQQGSDVLLGYLMPLLGYGVAGLGLAYVLLRREVMG